MGILKKNKVLIMRALAIVILIALCCGGCSYMNKRVGLKDDNWMEEQVEEYLKRQTGIDIDLTPGCLED